MKLPSEFGVPLLAGRAVTVDAQHAFDPPPAANGVLDDVFPRVVRVCDLDAAQDSFRASHAALTS